MKPDSIPPLHVVTDDRVVARPGFLDAARLVLEMGGPDVVLHLRAPRASGRALYDLARRMRPLAVNEDAWLVVNDRLDVALAAGVDGGHVGARGLAAADARRVLGADRLLGVSVHSVDEARDALAGEPDFLLAGTIWESASHPGRPGAGVGRIREIAALGVPAIAIGGVTPARAAEARDAGAAGFAVLRGVWDAPDPVQAVRNYLNHWMDR
ncbi:MAG TPA: thiamine phosphate synthase [Longimicrobium sp.]|nr:thiamine phosphate synthase [Longimicrobium sp.]